MASLNVSRGAGLLGVLALVACGATDQGSGSSPERTSTAAAAISGPVTYEFQVTLPGGAALVSTTVGAAQTVQLDDGASVLGPLASAGQVNIGPGASAYPTTATGSVDVDYRAQVTGNIVAGAAIDVAPSAHVQGTQDPFATSVAPYATTWSVTNPGNSQGPITLASGASSAPSPGVYDAVVAQSGATLYFATGTYFLQSLDLEEGATLVVDSRHGPVFVYASSGLTWGGVEQSADSSIPLLFVGDFGTSDVVVDSPFMGILIAPSAAIRLGVFTEDGGAPGNGHCGDGHDGDGHGGHCHDGYGQGSNGHGGYGYGGNGQGGNGQGGYGQHGGYGQGGDCHGGQGQGGTGSTAVVHTAGFYGATVEVGPNQVVDPADFDWSTVPGLPTPPGGWLANGGTTGRGGPGTTGGTGNGGIPTSTASIQGAAINISVSVDPNTGAGSGGPPSAPSSCVPFELPTSFDVGGELANGVVTLTFTSTVGSTNTPVTCTYRGGAPSATRKTSTQVEPRHSSRAPITTPPQPCDADLGTTCRCKGRPGGP